MLAFRNLLTLPHAPTGNVIVGLMSSPTLLGAHSFPVINHLTQRWKYRARKPMGAPRSRKKKYFVREPTPQIAEEVSELHWRYNHYRTATKSLMKHFAQWKMEHYPAEMARPSAVEKEPQQHVRDADFEQILQQNDGENARVAVAREARRMQELALREDERLEILADYEADQAHQLEKREQQVRRKKEVVDQMVTPENLEERIAKAYENPVDYNFCINLAGKRVYGRPDPLSRTNMAYTVRDDREAPPSFANDHPQPQLYGSREKVNT
ncbi:hypothetical protein BV898_02524 [Hypsibius exemplaris]|uniref:Small ribosomal subunit protein mS26 n=1 Tax=Hypsibius exemplaris TaxID=2072580 RepID=A0A1W0X8E6_HYPEX|nr:hypothetical protein BV898_02524 [Hypsibius exemplaris]